jgi:hypothetical protein
MHSGTGALKKSFLRCAAMMLVPTAAKNKGIRRRASKQMQGGGKRLCSGRRGSSQRGRKLG